MRHPLVVFCLAALTAACGSGVAKPLSAPSVPTTTTLSQPPQTISVGQEVLGDMRMHGARGVFELTAPSTGTLVARVEWTRTQGRLALWLDDALVSQADQPPLVGKVSVVGGGTYRVTVADAAPWDYDDWSLTYVLTTVIEF